MGQEQWMEAATNVVTSIIAIGFMTSYIGAKYKGVKRAFYFAGGSISYFLIVTILDMVVHFEGILGLAYSLLLLGYARAALEGSLWDEIVASWIWVFIALFSSFSVFTVVRLLAGYDFNYLLEAENEMRGEVLLVITALKVILSCAILLLLKRRSLSLKKKEGWAMAVTYTVMFAIVTGFFTVELHEENSEIRHILTVILMLGLVGIVIWISYYYWKLSAYNEEQMKIEFLKSYMDSQKKSIEELGTTYEEMRILRHDMGAHITNLYLMLKENQVKKALEYIEAKYKQIEAYSVMKDPSRNQGLNAALSRAAYICRKESIDFSYVIAGAVEKLDEADTGVLFYNLLNNAIEACEKVEGPRKIRLEIQEHDNSIKCILKNSIADSVLTKNPEMKSDKKDGKKHGYGMKSIMRLIDKYHGAYRREEEEGQFIQKILLSID